jgi:hypothetical protein
VISAVVIMVSVALAGAFTLAWLLSRSLREAIERPKHSFQDQLRRYDRQCREHRPAPAPESALDRAPGAGMQTQEKAPEE